MAGLVPAIHACGSAHAENVDARHKAGHDKFRDFGLGATRLSRGWGDVRAPLVGVIVMAGIVVRGVA